SWSRASTGLGVRACDRTSQNKMPLARLPACMAITISVAEMTITAAASASQPISASGPCERVLSNAYRRRARKEVLFIVRVIIGSLEYETLERSPAAFTALRTLPPRHEDTRKSDLWALRVMLN